jgi:hypothetical protein
MRRRRKHDRQGLVGVVVTHQARVRVGAAQDEDVREGPDSDTMVEAHPRVQPGLGRRSGERRCEPGRQIRGCPLVHGWSRQVRLESGGSDTLSKREGRNEISRAAQEPGSGQRQGCMDKFFPRPAFKCKTGSPLFHQLAAATAPMPRFHTISPCAIHSRE